MSSRGGCPSSPCAGAQTWPTPQKRRQPAGQLTVHGDDMDPSKPGTLSSERAVLGPPSAHSTVPVRGFWPLASTTSPTDEPVRSVRGPFQAAVNPTLALRGRRQPGTHREADTSPPTPGRRRGWLTARLEPRRTRAKHRARYERRDCAINPSDRCEADATVEAPKRPDSWTDVGIELRRALTVAASPKDERESTSHERRVA